MSINKEGGQLNPSHRHVWEGFGMSDDPLEEWRKANKEYFGNSTYRDRKKRFHEWMVSMWKAGHMPMEIRDIWVHDYIGDPHDEAA
jgi:hypothetical protein